MHSRLRILWLSWTAIVAVVLLTLTASIGVLTGDAARKQAAPELEQITEVIGTSLMREISRALSYDIPCRVAGWR